MKKQSNALWPRGVCHSMYGDNISTEVNQSEKHAKVICDLLEKEGFGGEKRAFPICTWVSDVQKMPKLPYLPEGQDIRKVEPLDVWKEMLKQGVHPFKIHGLAYKCLIWCNNSTYMDPFQKEKVMKEVKAFVTELEENL